MLHPWTFISCGDIPALLSCWPLNKPHSWLWILHVPWAVIHHAGTSSRPSCPSLYPLLTPQTQTSSDFPGPRLWVSVAVHGLTLMSAFRSLRFGRLQIQNLLLDLDPIEWLCSLSTTQSHLRGTYWPRGGLHSFSMLMWQSGQSLVPKAQQRKLSWPQLSRLPGEEMPSVDKKVDKTTPKSGLGHLCLWCQGYARKFKIS